MKTPLFSRVIADNFISLISAILFETEWMIANENNN